MKNTDLAKAINKAVQSGDVAAIASLVREDYIQHTPNVRDGREGLEELVFKIKEKKIPAPKITTIRSFEDNDFVILHQDVNWPNRKTMFEIFRMEDGLAAEHWSALMDHPDKTANGHTMTDGPTEIKDKSKTEETRKFVRDFVQQVLIGGAFDKILDYYHPQIIQHNPFIDNTVEGLFNGIKSLQEQGVSFQLQKIWKVFASGNFGLVCSEGLFIGKPAAFFDLFRLEDGKIVEHWDVIQEIPDRKTQAHQNGFFQLSLYERLGGYDGIAAYVDHAFPQVAEHPQLKHLFIGHADETKMRQRQLIIDKLVSTMQGPTIYLGKPLEVIHKGLNISPEQWDVFIKIMNKSMDERGIFGDTKTEFLKLFEQTFRKVTVEAELEQIK